MESNVPPPFSPILVEDAFHEALDEASASFLAGVDFEITHQPGLGTGAMLPNILNIDYSTPLVGVLAAATKNLKDAWLLILAHEAGHLRLNADCASRGLDASKVSSQMAAMGFDPRDPLLKKASAHQKESAVEAYCDACLCKASVESFGASWRPPVEALRDHRARASENISLFQGDHYATAPALDAFIASGGTLQPEHAARVALAATVDRTPMVKAVAVAGSDAVKMIADQLRERIEKRRQARDAKEREPRSGPKPPQ